MAPCVSAVLNHCSGWIHSQSEGNECLQCSLRIEHGVFQRASGVRGCLILRKDANSEVIVLCICGELM